MSFTGTQVIALANARARVGDSNIPDAQKLALLNDLLVKCGPYDAEFTLSTASTPALTSGTQIYQILSSGSIHRPVVVSFVGYRTSSTGQWTPMFQMGDSEAQAYDQDSGTPFAWYENNNAGVFEVGLVPKPNSTFAASGKAVLFRYKYTPPDLTATTDTIQLPVEYREYLGLMLGAEFADIDGSDPNLSAKLLARAERSLQKTVGLRKIKTALADYVQNPAVSGFSGGSMGSGVRRYLT